MYEFKVKPVKIPMAKNPAPVSISRVNPIATILAARMMLDWLGETAKAETLESAVAATIRKGQVRTKDMGGDASTLEMARAIAEKL